MASRRPFLLLRISFPGRNIFIQFVPALVDRRQQEDDRHRGEARGRHGDAVGMVDVVRQVDGS